MKKIALPILFTIAAFIYLAGCNDKNGDNNNPFIIVLGYNPTFWALDEPYVDAGAEAWDVTETGDTVNITDRMQVNENVNVTVAGEYQVNYNVSDEAGNSAEQKTRIVKVVLTK